jgi:hypothetical protein
VAGALDAFVAPRPGDMFGRPDHACLDEVVVTRAPNAEGRRLHAGQAGERRRLGLGRDVRAVPVEGGSEGAGATAWGLSDWPNPRRSGAITRKPASASAGIW